MRLYDIAADFRRLSDLLEDESTPEEMRQTIIDTLESVQGDFEEKAEAMAEHIHERSARRRVRGLRSGRLVYQRR